MTALTVTRHQLKLVLSATRRAQDKIEMMLDRDKIDYTARPTAFELSGDLSLIIVELGQLLEATK